MSQDFEFLGYGPKTIIMAWLGFIAVTAFSIGLIAHHVQDLMNVQDCIINNFHYDLDVGEGKNGSDRKNIIRN